jgi:hypothetical protein
LANIYDTITGTKHVVIETDEVAFDVDATTSEQHSDTSTVTTNPIEGGAYISDHVIDNPIPLSLDIVISDDPLKFLAVSGSLSRAFSDAEKPSIEVYDFLKKSKLERKLFTVTTTLETLFNMVLVGIRTTRTAATSRGLFANLQFQNVKIVESQTVQREGATDADTDRGATKSAKGKKSKTAATPAQETQASSALVKLGLPGLGG